MSFMPIAGNDFGASTLHHVALIGNSIPRRCGLATFTTDCHDALRAAFPAMQVDHYAMDDGKDDLAYPDGIHLIRQDDPLAYSEAARQIGESGAQAIWLQHEFGIFGGPAGDMILRLLARTRLPLSTTLHTILEAPDADQRRVLDAIMARSSTIMVMAERGREILSAQYPEFADKLRVIPHGVPDRLYVQPDAMKARFGFDGHKVLLTFGLLAPDKGIDSMIRALPAIVAQHPDALYVVLGATHPNIRRERGEAYRHELMAMANDLGVAGNVRFIDSFVETPELLDYLQAADLYVTPYRNPGQITSGTLSYAVAMGKPVISTPYIHATEILANDTGLLVDFGDSAAMADRVCMLLSDDLARRGYAARAYTVGRDMIWTVFAQRTADLLRDAMAAVPTRLPAQRRYRLVEPDLSGVLRMCDATGMLQHAILTVPDRNHGYCIDDNARALILMTQVDNADPAERDRWANVFAAFVQHGWNPDRGRFRNFMRFDRQWCEEEGSQDSCGRTLWALGVTARDAAQPALREWATGLYNAVLPHLESLTAPRARAFAILGAGAMLDAQPGHAASRTLMDRFAHLIAGLMEDGHVRRDWKWFEPSLAYDNARLPQALLLAGRHLGDAALVRTGVMTLDWLIGRQTAAEGHFRAVGSESFGRDYAEPLPFDQQPLEAQATIEAAIDAYRVAPHPRWVKVAEAAYRWFWGQNDLDVSLGDRQGGCFDGLTPDGVNRNQGAESLLALQLSACAMQRLSDLIQIVPDTERTDTEAVSA